MWSRFKNILRGLWGTFWILVAAVLVVAALSLALLRTVLPGAGMFHDDLESWIGAEAGVPVKIEEISLALDGRFLEITAHHVTVFDPASGEPQLSFKDGGIQIDILSSISFGEIVTTTLSISRPKLAIIHRRDGSLSLESGSQGDGMPPFFIGWLFSQPSLTISDAEVLISEENFSDLQWHLSDVDLTLVSSGYRHQASGSVVLAGESSAPIQLRLEWFGDLLNPYGWDGQMYMQGKGVELTNLIGGVQNPWIPLAQGSADLEWWGEWLSGRLEKGRGTLERDTEDLQLPGLAGGEFFWKKRADDEWRLQMDRLVWGGKSESERTNHPSSALIERRKDSSGKDLLLGAADHIHLVSSPALSGLYTTFFSGENGILVAGELHQVQFRSYPTSSSLINQVEAQMEVKDISIQGLKNMAGQGLSGINGQLGVSQQGGVFVPTAGELVVRAGDLYPQPLQIELQQGTVAWRKYPAGLLLSSETLQGSFGELELKGKMQLLMPAGGGSPVVDLQARLSAQRVAALMTQLPEAKMNPRLVRWLKAGLLSGELSDGRIVFNGPLNRFPFDQGGGEFIADLQIRDIYLNYAAEWPTITNGQAKLVFHNESLQMEMDGGKIDGHPIHDLVMVSEQVGKSPLMIHGQIVSESKKLLRTLENTPLQQRATQFNSLLSMDGYAFLDLGVEVPLKKGSQVQVEGRVELHGNRLSLKDLELELEQVRGNVEFTNEGFSIEGIRGELLGGPVTVTAFTAGYELQSELVVGLEGELLGEKLEQWWFARAAQGGGEKGSMHLPLSMKGVESEEAKPMLQWGGRLKVGLSRRGEKIDENVMEVHLHSNLKGVEMLLPAPLNKLGQESWPTTLTMALSSGELERVRLSTPDHFMADLQKKGGDGGNWSGLILLGEVAGVDPANRYSDEVSIQGSLGRVDLDEWLAWRREFSESKGGIGLPGFGVHRVALNAMEAVLLGQRLNNLSVVVNRQHSNAVDGIFQKGNWGVGISSDQLQGSIKVPFDQESAVTVKLDHIYWGADHEELSGRTSAAGVDIDSTQLPSMVVNSRKTVINGIDFGKLHFKANQTKSGLFFDDVTLESEAMMVSAQGSWMQRPWSDTSRFNIHVTGDELGKILSLFDYGGEIDRGVTSIQIKSEWPGGPTDFSLGAMEGRLQLLVEKGQLRDVEQGVGRVFGLLGVHTLARRLTLDFSDITNKGFPFDTIEGSFMVQNGHAHTSDLRIDGSAATIKASGRTGLVAQDYDQVVSVSPKISESLPATGALLGGPAGAAVGGVVMLYQKLFKKDGIITTRYNLTGTWDEPKLEKIEKARATPPVSAPFSPQQQIGVQ